MLYQLCYLLFIVVLPMLLAVAVLVVVFFY